MAKYGDEWTDKFWVTITEHRKIKQAWNFDHRSKELMRQYYDANKFLVTCLSSDWNLTGLCQQRIRETLHYYYRLLKLKSEKVKVQISVHSLLPLQRHCCKVFLQ